MIVINSTFTKIKYPLSAGFELSIQCPQYQWERKTDHIELNSNTKNVYYEINLNWAQWVYTEQSVEDSCCYSS